MLENIQNINIWLLNYLNNFSNNDLVAQTVYIFADAPIFFLPIFLLSYWIYYSYTKKIDEKKSVNKKSDLLFIFYWTILAIMISIIIQQFVNLDRPEQHLTNSAKLLLDHIPDASFPSDHASVSFAFLTWLFLAWYKKIWYIFSIFVIIMNLSRIIAWVHWPFDVLAWAIIWVMSSFIVFKYFRKIYFVESFNKWIVKMLGYVKL